MGLSHCGNSRYCETYTVHDGTFPAFAHSDTRTHIPSRCVTQGRKTEALCMKHGMCALKESHV